MLAHWKHLSLDDRKTISNMVAHGARAKEIAAILGVDPTAVSKEVKRNRTLLTAELGECPKCARWPFVCDNCPKKYGKACAFTKWAYKPAAADETAAAKLRNTRRGIYMGEAEFKAADEAIKAGVAEGKSLYEIAKLPGMPSASTAYRWVGSGILQTKAVDLPRAVKYRKRERKQYDYGGSSKLKEGRHYLDYLAFRRENPALYGWQMDFLGSIVSDRSAIIAFAIPELSFPLIKKLPKGDPAAVVSLIDRLEAALGADFGRVVPFILADDPCFADFTSLEFSPATGERRLRVYYADPYVSNQKGCVENLNGQLRRYFPKGASVDGFSDSTIAEINEALIGRRLRSLGGETPRDAFVRVYGEAALAALLSA